MRLVEPGGHPGHNVPQMLSHADMRLLTLNGNRSQDNMGCVPSFGAQISSSLTYFYKRIFPALLIIGFGALTVWLWIGNLTGQAWELRWIALVAWGCGTGFLVWYSRMLKEVWLYGDQLIVSDFDTEERVPLRQVEEVKETRFRNPKLITLRLRRAGRWGDRIVFIAPIRFQFVFMNHPLAGELRSLVSEARVRGVGQDLDSGGAGGQ